VPGRWEGDERGRGVGNADALVAGAGELVAAFAEPAWVAEEPQAHLLPHVSQWCEVDGRLALRGSSVDDHGALVLDLVWQGEPLGVGQVRAAAFALIGSFAESATYVRQRRPTDEGSGSQTRARFEVGTGELRPDSRFLPHGHVVVLDVTM
jgi:hypothetical protein